MEIVAIITLVIIVSATVGFTVHSVGKGQYQEMLDREYDRYQEKLKFEKKNFDAECEKKNRLITEILETNASLDEENKKLKTDLDETAKLLTLKKSTCEGLRLSCGYWKKAYEDLEKEKEDSEKDHQEQIEELNRFNNEKIQELKDRVAELEDAMAETAEGDEQNAD